MSFFDEDDEPTRRAPRPRRASPAGPAAVDPQQIWGRRLVALGLAALLLVGLVVGVNSCRVSARKNALKDYNREVGALVKQSDDEVGAGFFELLSQGDAESPEDLQTAISGFKEQSETLLDQAERVDVPDEMVPAHRSLLIAFEMRRDGLQFIAERVATAMGDEGDTADEAIEQIAGQMQGFLASDVLIDARVVPLVNEELDAEEIGGQDPIRPPEAKFLSERVGGLSWLDPATVATALGTQLSEGGRNRDPDEEPTPGLHGTGLTSVTVGDTTLQPDASNRVPVGEDLTFTVAFANQGDNDEFDVEVVLTLEGPGKPIRGTRTIDRIAQGETAEANIALPRAPTVGEVYTVRAEVKPVPGEKKTDNNSQEYPVLFTQ